MPCIDLPILSVPQLPGPLTLAMPSAILPNPSVGLTLCCKISIPLPDLPYPLNGQPPLPPIVAAIPGIESMLLAAVGEVNSFLQALPADCPLNSTP